MAMAVLYPELLRKTAGIPETSKIIVGIALGYPDADCPVNEFERKRAGVDEFVKWVK